MSDPAKSSRSTSQIVLGNTVWLTLDMAVTLLTVFGVSIPVYRVIGPAHVAYFSIVQWLAYASANVLSLGIPGTARRYVTEALAANDLPAARGIVFSTVRLQMFIAAGLLAAGEAFVFLGSDRTYWSSSWLIVLGLAPRMLMSLPSLVQVAANRLKENLICVLIAAVLQVTIVVISLWAGWGLPGVAAGIAIGNSVECLLKFFFLMRWLGWGPVKAIGPELRRRMTTFSGQGVAILILNLVVWDKSDVLILKMLVHDQRTWAFFTVSFNLADRVISIISTFVSSMAISVFNELGEGAERINRLAAVGMHYALLAGSPLLLGLAGVAPAFIQTLYGKAYAPAGAILAIAAAFAFGKCVMPILNSLYQATERQGVIVIWGIVCGAINISLDFVLISYWGATGAALANGISQLLTAAGLIVWAARSLGVQWSLRQSIPGVLAAGGSGVVAFCAIHIGGLSIVRLVAGIVAGAITYPVFVRLFGVLQAEDVQRFRHVAARIPARGRFIVDGLLRFVAPASQS
jgi:O-antigen/teichoic acid export membrane protein